MLTERNKKINRSSKTKIHIENSKLIENILFQLYNIQKGIKNVVKKIKNKDKLSIPKYK